MRTQIALNRYALLDTVSGNYQSRFAIIENDRFTRNLHSNVILEHVQFQSHPGFRLGCQSTGLLGTAVGVLLEPELPSRLMHEQIAVKFNGKMFIRLDNNAIVEDATRLLLTTKGAYAQFVADPVEQFCMAKYIFPDS